MQSTCLREKLPLLYRTEHEYYHNDNDNDDNSLCNRFLLINVPYFDPSEQLHFTGSSQGLKANDLYSCNAIDKFFKQYWLNVKS